MSKHGKVPPEHDKLNDWRQGRKDAEDEIDTEQEDTTLLEG